MKKLYSAKGLLRMLYGIMLLLAFHFYFLLYTQSTFISRFVNDAQLTLVYGCGAIISLILLFAIPLFLKKFLDTKIALVLAFIEILLCLILGYSQSPAWIIAAFIIQQGIIPIISYTIDILIEHYSKHHDTGRIRGTVLTISNAALIIAPILAGYVAQSFDLPGIYQFSLIFFIPLFILFFLVEHSGTEALYKNSPSFTTTWHNVWTNTHRDIRRVFMTNLFLQIFYTWMVIYSPLYLLEKGFDWEQIGVIFGIMLIPFLVLELPFGIIADKYGHKKMLALGVLTISIATILFGYIESPTIWLWAAVLFMSRVGAAAVEIMTESYFFKHVRDQDLYDISLFRATRPLAQIVGPVLATASIWMIGSGASYIALGLIVLISIFYILPLRERHEFSKI